MIGFDYASDRRVELVATPLSVPEHPTEKLLRWAIFCAASVEYLCGRYDVPCPSWVHDPQYASLAESWFDAPMAHKPSVRAFLLEETPEPFVRRNIYCGKRVFANKYEFAEQYHRLSTISAKRLRSRASGVIDVKISSSLRGMAEEKGSQTFNIQEKKIPKDKEQGIGDMRPIDIMLLYTSIIRKR